MRTELTARQTARAVLQSIVPRLSDAERKEYFNLHYWRYLETLTEMIPWSGKRVLDIGIFPGHLAMALKALGCDVLEEEIAVTRAIVDRDPLPFSDNSLDGVLFTEVLEHLLYDPMKVVEEIYRVLRPNGQLLVSTPNVLRIENRIKLILGQNIYPAHDYFYFSNLYRRHNREYTMQEVINLFQSRFRTKNARYIMLFEYAVPVSEHGKVFDTHEYAEIGAPRESRNGHHRNLREIAKPLLRLPKAMFPPFRSGLLASFESLKKV